jgi:hypothetical protein
VCPEEANTTQKKLLQRPTSLEIADKPGVDPALNRDAQSSIVLSPLN